MSDEPLEVVDSSIDVTCSRCGEVADVHVTGFGVTVEVSPDADVEVHRTDRNSAAIHFEDGEEEDR